MPHLLDCGIFALPLYYYRHILNKLSKKGKDIPDKRPIFLTLFAGAILPILQPRLTDVNERLALSGSRRQVEGSIWLGSVYSGLVMSA